jgi:hypothetical protein
MAEAQKKRIDVREAVNTAKTYLATLMEGLPQDILLEECELLDNDRWQITLSFVRPDNPQEQMVAVGDMRKLFGVPNKPRHYRCSLWMRTPEPFFR